MIRRASGRRPQTVPYDRQDHHIWCPLLSNPSGIRRLLGDSMLVLFRLGATQGDQRAPETTRLMVEVIVAPTGQSQESPACLGRFTPEEQVPLVQHRA